MTPNPLPRIDSLGVSANWEDADDIANTVAKAQRFADWVWMQPIVEAVLAVARIKTYKDVAWSEIEAAHEGAKRAAARLGIEES